MVYVVKRKEDKNVWIGPNMPKPTIQEVADENEPKALYAFKWDYNETLSCLRWFIQDPSQEKSNYYLPEVLDYLETVKELPNPPKEEINRIYKIPKKIEEFKDGIRVLSNIGLIEHQTDKNISDAVIYDVDLVSQYYRNYPSAVVDMVMDWIDLSEETRKGILEIHKTKNLDRQRELQDSINIPDKFLPMSLKITISGGQEVLPEFLNTSKLAEEEKKELTEAEKYLETLKPDDIIDPAELATLGITLASLSKRFEISRNWRKGLYKIIRKL